MGFFVVYDRIVPGQNKYMATLFNQAAGRKITIEKISRCNWQTAAVTGVLCELELRMITARTAGVNVPIQAEDGQVQLTAGILADTNSTGVTELPTGMVKRFYAENEEITLTNYIPQESADAQTVWWRRPGSSGLVARQNQGITIKNITNTNVGTLSFIIEFRDDPAT